MVSTRMMSISSNRNTSERNNSSRSTDKQNRYIVYSKHNPFSGTSNKTTNGINSIRNSASLQFQSRSPQIVKDLNSHGNLSEGSDLTINLTLESYLLNMPMELLTNIFSYMDYKKISQIRLVSQKVNNICMHILNSTFSKLIKETFNRFHAIKANMPRRESARRNHPLSCECDIIETCYMRLSLLQMTFGKHIERGHCCFFPGAILDEVYAILSYIRKTPRLERPYRVTDELFDLSTMAMEYFRDRIEPTLPEIGYFNKDFLKIPNSTKRTLTITTNVRDEASSLPSLPQSNMILRKGIRKIKQGMKIYNNQLSVLRNELRICKRRSTEQGKQIAEQQKLLAEQQKQTLEYANRLDENDKKSEEIARKFSSLLQELNKCKTEMQYWRSKNSADVKTCTPCRKKVVELNHDAGVDSECFVCTSNIPLKKFPDELVNLFSINIKKDGTQKNIKTQNPITSTTLCNKISNDLNGNMQPINENNIAARKLINYKNHEDDVKIMKDNKRINDFQEYALNECEHNKLKQIIHNDEEIVNSKSTDRVNPNYAINICKNVIADLPILQISEMNFPGSWDHNTKDVYKGISSHKSVKIVGEVGEVTSLSSLTSHETKKARRVQKIKCMNTSSKRNKKTFF